MGCLVSSLRDEALSHPKTIGSHGWANSLNTTVVGLKVDGSSSVAAWK